jgi:dinuclear metal center YbgI/SA1388 family protein
MKLYEIINLFDREAPFSLQESYDNSGLQTGSPDMEVNSALICVDVTEEIVEEALHLKANLIISHHPVLFHGVKSLTGKTSQERILLKAIRSDIAILSIHTNIDSILSGVSAKMCEKIGLVNTRILEPVKNMLVKLVFFVPVEHAGAVREKIFQAGAGIIGNYDMCSFNAEGEGTFRGSEQSNPFTGEKGKLHYEREIRVETIMPSFISKKVIKTLLEAHPYEEVAYDLYPLENLYPLSGMGMIGELKEESGEMAFLGLLKEKFSTACIRYTRLLGNRVKKVAVCGGSGSSLLGKAIESEADVYVTGDFKYHQFFDAEGKILIADIGHYESEQFVKELFYELLIKNYPKFAVYLTKVNTNPVNYL